MYRCLLYHLGQRRSFESVCFVPHPSLLSLAKGEDVVFWPVVVYRSVVGVRSAVIIGIAGGSIMSDGGAAVLAVETRGDADLSPVQARIYVHCLCC